MQYKQLRFFRNIILFKDLIEVSLYRIIRLQHIETFINSPHPPSKSIGAVG